MRYAGTLIEFFFFVVEETEREKEMTSSFSLFTNNYVNCERYEIMKNINKYRQRFYTRGVRHFAASADGTTAATSSAAAAAQGHWTLAADV